MNFKMHSFRKPILKWAGGKAALSKQLFPYFPKKFNTYFEPFMGGGAVFFALDDSIQAHVNDINPELIHLYKVVRDNPEDLMNYLDNLQSQYSEEFYYSLRNISSEHPVEKAARTLFLNKTGYNGLYRLNSRGQFNVPFGKRKNCPRLYRSENFKAVSKRLKNCVLWNDDFEKVLDGAQAGDFVYCDPPYVPLSKTANFTSYTTQRFAKKEQLRLAAVCHQLTKRGVLIAVSNSHNDYVPTLYQGWRCLPVFATRVINSNRERRGKIPEILICNYPY